MKLETHFGHEGDLVLNLKQGIKPFALSLFKLLTLYTFLTIHTQDGCHVYPGLFHQVHSLRPKKSYAMCVV